MGREEARSSKRRIHNVRARSRRSPLYASSRAAKVTSKCKTSEKTRRKNAQFVVPSVLPPLEVCREVHHSIRQQRARPSCRSNDEKIETSLLSLKVSWGNATRPLSSPLLLSTPSQVSAPPFDRLVATLHCPPCPNHVVGAATASLHNPSQVPPLASS